VARVGPGQRDADAAQVARPAVGHGDRLGAAGGADLLAAERYVRHRERDGGGGRWRGRRAGAAQRDALRAVRRVVREGQAGGAGVGVPWPLSATLCGLSGALSTKARLALRAPMAVGAKATSTVQVLPEATVVPLQVSLPVVKSPGLAPVSATLVMARFAASVLVTVTVWAALVVPTCWLPKER